jgi:transcriptional regulator with XRE-family HTH domain
MARTKFLLKQPTNYARLSRELAYLRTKAEMSQREVAQAVGISPSQYGRLERGELLDRPSFEDIVRVGRFFNIKPDRLAELMGLWPVPEIQAVEADPRIAATLGFIAQMPDYKLDGFIDLFYKTAALNAAEDEPKLNL